jgi:hypothetical protein
MISCASVKEKAVEFATQMHEAGLDQKRINDIYKDKEEYRKDLSPEERAEFDKTYAETERKLAKEDFKKSCAQ